jgi:VanZ family protein
MWAVALLVGAVVPQVPATVASVPDGWLHAVGYGGQAGLLAWLFDSSGSAGVVSLGSALLGATLFGAATELLQLLIPGRAAALGDLLADAVGAFVVCAALAVATTVVRRGGQPPR